MKFTWINHASYLLEVSDVKMVCDPWMEGRVFNDSWELLSPTKFTYEDFKDVTHIWFSHEHPDHFFPPNVKKIPEAYRKEITVLFQKTKDQKVAEFCRKFGFKEVIELEAMKEYEIGKDVMVVNGTVVNDIDSWLLVKSNEGNVLNLNDCEVEAAALSNTMGTYCKNIDVLLTQFSYASYVGNPDDVESKKKHASKKIKSMDDAIVQFRPSYVIPFASYVWFCHEDNFHMNAEANGIDKVLDHLNESKTKPIVLYPGETWHLNDEHDNESSVNAYLKDLSEMSERKLTHFERIAEAQLQEVVQDYSDRFLKRNDRNKLFSYDEMRIYLSDHEQAYSFSFKNGLNRIERSKNDCDVSMSSQNLQYCLKYDWGFDTINVAGTFEIPQNGEYQRYMEYRWLSTINNQGKRIGNILERGINKLLTFIQKRP